MSNLRITYKKSSIGYPATQKATIRALGLSKIRQTIEQADSPHIRGVVKVPGKEPTPGKA